MTTPAAFMAAASAPSRVRSAGSSPWAERYAAYLRRMVTDYANSRPRSLQVHLGPSEIGHVCDGQVVAKMAGAPVTNHVVDPWPSFVGTALHREMEHVLRWDNSRLGPVPRWIPEQRVTPHPNHPGTADAYDGYERAVTDWKFLGDTTLTPLVESGEPPIHYVVQLLLYGHGYRLLGLPVDRVALAAWPRTKSSMHGLYVWERPYTPADDELLAEVFARNDTRTALAAEVRAGRLNLNQIPITPSDQDCYFCLAGETEVVTRQGVRQIRELAGATHELLIPTGSASAPRGTFKPAPVRSLGRQPLYAVRLRRYRATKTVYATAEHRWVLPDYGAEVTTAELTPGTSLASVRAQPVRQAELVSVAVAQGFTFGDGTHGQDRRPATLAIYGRSKKSAVLDHFPPVSQRLYETSTGDQVTHIYGLPRFWKRLPPLEESRAFLLSWLAGYFAADGTVSAQGQASISSADRTALEFVRDAAAICGVGHGLITTRSRIGAGTEPTDLHSLDLTTRDLPDWFWLLPHHAAAAERRTNTAPRTTHWSVAAIEATDRVEEVFCATVEGVQSFGLADGLTTGNCPFYRPESARDGLSGCPGMAGQRAGRT